MLALQTQRSSPIVDRSTLECAQTPPLFIECMYAHAPQFGVLLRRQFVVVSYLRCCLAVVWCWREAGGGLVQATRSADDGVPAASSLHGTGTPRSQPPRP